MGLSWLLIAAFSVYFGGTCLVDQVKPSRPFDVYPCFTRKGWPLGRCANTFKQEARVPCLEPHGWPGKLDPHRNVFVLRSYCKPSECVLTRAEEWSATACAVTHFQLLDGQWFGPLSSETDRFSPGVQFSGH